jgi:molybdate transport system substrate-binding protein
MTTMKVYCTIGMQSAVEELLPQLENASGCTLAFTWATAPMLVRRLQAGEKTDVMILNRAGIETMVKEGRITAGSAVKLAGSPVALAV